MSDPITTIITTAVEHAPSAVAVAATLKAAKDFLAKVTGPAVEELGEIGRDYVKGWRAKNGNAVLAGADTLLAEAGREPQAVPLKVLLPLLDAASLEDETTLADRWAALLANAADPAQRVQVQPGFAEILRQLTLDDVAILHQLQHAPQRLAEATTANKFILTEALLHASSASISETMFKVSLDNLMRLRLCIGHPVLPERGANGDFDYTYRVTVLSHDLIAGDRYVALSAFGLAFLAAVTPPIP